MATSSQHLTGTAPAYSPAVTETPRTSEAVKTARVSLVSSRENWALFLIAALPLVVLGLYAALERGIYHVDALARSYTAIEVVRGYEPKLANLDLAWPPVPGLLQLPIAFLLPNVTASGGAGPIVSALSTAVCVVLMNRILASRLPGKPLRYALLLLIFGNPLLLGLAVSGVTEMTGLVFILLAWTAFERLASGAAPILPIALLGATTGTLIMCRFEAGLAAMLLGVALLAYLLPRRGDAGWHYVGAMGLAYVAPIAYVCLVFLFLSATITGNPFYFASSAGSNTVYSRVIVQATPRLAELVHAPFATLRYLIEQSLAFAPLFLFALPLGLIVAWRRRDLSLAGLCALSLFLPLTQALLLFDGQSAGWERYLFTNAVFAGPLLLWALAKSTPARVSTWATLAVLAGLLVSDAYAYTRLDDATIRNDLASSERTAGYLPTLFGRNPATGYDPQIETELQMATALRETLFAQEPDARVLVDNSQATRIILFSERQNHFVTQNVIAFEDILAEPAGHVEYLLVPDTLPERNQILLAYPDLFSGRYPQFTLVYQFSGVFLDAGNTFIRWGLFRVETGGLPVELQGAS